MNKRLPPEDRALKLRVDLFAVMDEHGATLEEAAEMFAQCAGILTNSVEIAEIAKAAGLELRDYRNDEHLELYFSVYRDEKVLGYISKGWDDPGFRMGNIISVLAAQQELLRAHSQRISRLCATNGIIVTANENGDPVELQLESVILKAGFNKKVFLQTLENLTECGDKVRGLLTQ